MAFGLMSFIWLYEIWNWQTELSVLCCVAFIWLFQKLGKGTAFFLRCVCILNLISNLCHTCVVFQVIINEFRHMISCSVMISLSSAAHPSWIFIIRVCLSVCHDLSSDLPHMSTFSLCGTASEIKLKCEQAVQSETNLNSMVIPPWNCAEMNECTALPCTSSCLC